MTEQAYRHAGHRVRRLGLSRPPRGARAGASAATASASRCAGRSSPAICSRSAGSARSTPCRPICAIRLGRGRGARRRRRDQSGRHPVRARPAALRRGAGGRRRAVALAAQRRWRARWCMSRRSAPTRIRPRIMRAPRRRASGWCWRRMPDAIIMRPSIMFGPEDDFFNRFAALARMSPALPLIGGGLTRFQPVFVGDVARGDRRRGRRRAQRRHDLRAGRAGGADLQGADAISCSPTIERSRAAGAAAVRRWPSCRRCSCNSCRSRRSRPIRSNCCGRDNVVSRRRPSAKAARCEALGIEPVRSRRRADLSLALPQDRPVHDGRGGVAVARPPRTCTACLAEHSSRIGLARLLRMQTIRVHTFRDHAL